MIGIADMFYSFRAWRAKMLAWNLERTEGDVEFLQSAIAKRGSIPRREQELKRAISRRDRIKRKLDHLIEKSK